MNKKLLKTAFIDSIPVLTGYIPLGMGFGIMLESAGYNYIWAFFMAITMFAGSMQYLAVDLLATAASPITVFISTLLVNARHLFYGISLIDKYRGAGLKKFYMMFGLTDETYSLVCASKLPEGINPHNYYLLVTFFNHIYWITGCVLGALLGSMLSFEIVGIDFVLTSLFVTIFIEQWLSTKEHRPALIGIASTVICLFVFGQQNFLIASMAVILILITLFRRKIAGE